MQGVELDRKDPPEWFQWLNDEKTVFHTRCADPPTNDQAIQDDGYQPYNYFIRAKLSRSIFGKLSAQGQDFYHDTDMLRPFKSP